MHDYFSFINKFTLFLLIHFSFLSDFKRHIPPIIDSAATFLYFYLSFQHCLRSTQRLLHHIENIDLVDK